MKQFALGALATVTFITFLTTSALAEIVTVCGVPDSLAAAETKFESVTPLSQILAQMKDKSRAVHREQIALSRDASGFDIVLNWRQGDEQSRRGMGAEIHAMELGANLVHLIVARDEERLEHFLFSLDENGAGELLWSASDDDQNAASSHAVCVHPR